MRFRPSAFLARVRSCPRHDREMPGRPFGPRAEHAPPPGHPYDTAVGWPGGGAGRHRLQNALFRAFSNGQSDAPMQNLAFYDMDKTITAAPTWTRFLVHAARMR